MQFKFDGAKRLGSFKTKPVFCGIKTKELLEANGFTVDVYLDYAASELAEIITVITIKESYTFFSGNLRKETLQALKEAGITFNEIEVYQTALAPFKISDQEILTQ
jgi:uroporphyrinogen-III synthase